MSYIEIILISIGLAMDAFAVSICKGISIKKLNLKKCLIVGLWFGLFQGLMPLLGYYLGSTFESFITRVDHYIAFVLLSIIGIDMLKNGLSKKREDVNDDLSFKSMIIFSIATSIDALAVGIAYVCAYRSKNALMTFSSILIITFILSSLGVYIGNKFGSKFEKKSKTFGGIILILLGVRILFEHLNIIK